jgi:hypothetical protein
MKTIEIVVESELGIMDVVTLGMWQTKIGKNNSG